MKKYLLCLFALLIAVILPVGVVLAAPSNVVFVYANPQDTSIYLRWVTSNATTTVVVYKTTGFPANPADGTVCYSGTSYYHDVTGLTAGTRYYFSAWGFDGVNYSPTPAHIMCNTLAAALPTGSESPVSNPIPLPTISANASANATIAGFNLEPFTSIISMFNTGAQRPSTGATADNMSWAVGGGGLGMPINNAWETIATLIIVFLGLMVYRSNKNFFVAYGVVFILTCFAIGMHLIQWYLAPIEICVGLGVWALERFFQ